MANTKEILYEFTQTTSSHGIPHIGRAKSNWIRVFWTVIFLAALALLVWQVTLLVKKYLDYDKITKMELKFQQRNFPAVTICNLNPLKQSRLLEEKQADLINKLLSTYVTAAFLLNNNQTGNESQNADMETFNFKNINDTVALQTRAKDALIMAIAQVAKQYSIYSQSRDDTADKGYDSVGFGFIKSLSYNQSDFIVSCSFNTEDCRPDDFQPLFDAKFGNCFTFNNRSDPSVYKSNRAGPLYGLRAVFMTETKEYLRISESSGVRIVVHDQSEQPFPDTFGFNAATGYATSFGISYSEIKRLGKPYGECVDKAKMQPNSSSLYFNTNYTMEGCFRDGWQHYVIKKCGCGDPRYPLPIAANSSTPGSGYCTFEDRRQSDCLQGISSQMSQDITHNFNCPDPCHEGVYDVTVSSAKWPSGSFMVPGCNGELGNCTERYRENALMIEVYYEQLNYRLMEETPAYSLVNLVSDFGGQAGLWLGVSVVTAIEVLLLLFHICTSCCKSSAPLAPTAVESFKRVSAVPLRPLYPNHITNPIDPAAKVAY